MEQAVQIVLYSIAGMMYFVSNGVLVWLYLFLHSEAQLPRVQGCEGAELPECEGTGMFPCNSFAYNLLVNVEQSLSTPPPPQ